MTIQFRRRDGLFTLCAGYSPKARREKLLSTLQAYIDDSRKDIGQKALFLAGYINSADSWMAFSDAWAEALDRSPSIEYLHMVEAKAMRGQFKGWSAEDRNQKLVTLAQIIRDSAPWSFQVRIDLSAYEMIFGHGIPYAFRSPYFVAFIACVVSVARVHANLGIQYPVDFIFDEMNQIHRSATALYQGFKRDQPEHLRDLMGATPIFRSDRDVLPLQAADMLAWHVRRETRSDGEVQHSQPATDLLLRDKGHYMFDLEPRLMSKIKEGLVAIPKLSDLSDKKVWKRVVSVIEAGNL